MKHFWRKHWFYAGMAALAILAFLLPEKTFLGTKPRILEFFNSSAGYLIAFIFVASGVRLETRSLLSEIRNVKGILFGLISIFLVAPIIAVVLSRVFSLSGDLYLGMALVAAMPTTIASGIIIVSLAGGNMALALCLTVISNLICPLTIPLVLRILGGRAIEVNLPVTAMMWNLCKVIVLPFLLGQIIRPFARTFIEKIKTTLSITCQIIVLSFIFTSLWGSIDQIIALRLKIFMLTGMVLLLHVLMMVYNFFGAGMLGLNYDSRKTVTIVGSQKTLAAAFQVWNDVFGASYIIMIPSVLHHLFQLIVDIPIANRWHGKKQRIDSLRQEKKLLK